MNPKALSTLAIQSAGEIFKNTRTGLPFKGLSNGSGSNMIRCILNTDLQLSDLIQSQSESYFITDSQQDVAAQYVSIFPVTHTLTNSTTGEQVPAHLGHSTPAGPTDQAGFPSSPAQFIFWIPSRFKIDIGDFFTTTQGITLRVAAIRPTDNDGLQVLMYA